MPQLRPAFGAASPAVPAEIRIPTVPQSYSSAPDYGALRRLAREIAMAVDHLEGEQIFPEDDPVEAAARVQACEVAVLKAARAVAGWLAGLTRTEVAA